MCHQHHQWNELVCLKQNQVCIHCPSFLDEHFSSTKRGRKRKVGRRRVCGCVCVGGKSVKRGQGLQWRRKRRENDVWQNRNLPLHWDMIGFSLVQEQQKQKNKIKKERSSEWCSKNKDDRGRGELLAGMWCWLLLCCWYFFSSSFCSIKPR